MEKEKSMLFPYFKSSGDFILKNFHFYHKVAFMIKKILFYQVQSLVKFRTVSTTNA